MLKLKEFLKEHGRLFCEVCSFCFHETYGEIGRGLIEVHHLVPLSQMEENHRTTVDELMCICSNCHFAVHNGDPTANLKSMKTLPGTTQRNRRNRTSRGWKARYHAPSRRLNCDENLLRCGGRRSGSGCQRLTFATEMKILDPFTPPRILMDQISSKFNVLFLLLLSLGSGSLFCSVLLGSHFHVWGFSEEELGVIDKLPVSVVMLAVGFGAFALFFPWFIALVCVRWALSEFRRLENVISDQNGRHLGVEKAIADLATRDGQEANKATEARHSNPHQSPCSQPHT